MQPDFITLMSPLGGGSTGKFVKADGTVQVPGQHYWHRAAQVKVTSFLELAYVLTKASADPARSLYAVRGRIRPGVDASKCRRTHKDEDATLEPAPHRWLLLDVDKYRLDVPASEFAADPGKYAAQVREALPEGFRQAACWWQATGSAGMKPGLRLRLAFWLDRAMDDSDLKAWLADWSVPLDLSLYTPSQPHFLASPEFENPAMDPVKRRCGWLRGEPEARTREPSYASGAAEELAKAVRSAARSKEGTRRNLINTAAFKLALAYAEDELAADLIRDSLYEAGTKWEKMDGAKTLETLTTAIRDGRAKRAKAKEGWRKDLAQDKAGNPLPTAANVSLYLEYHPAFAGKLAYNERDFCMYWTGPAPWGEPVARKVTEADGTYGVEWFQAQAHMVLKGPQPVMAGLYKASKLRTFDPVQQYLTGLPKWDGRERAADLFVRLLGVDDTELTREQTRIALAQAYRRAFATAAEPVKADHVLVLYGEQGLGKSSVLSLLCPLPTFFADSLPPMHSKDAVQALASSWIVELGEMTQRKADQDQFKNFISRVSDKFRPPYAKDTLDVPRRCALFGSTNDDEFLTDTTGNRRFWPMTCTRELTAQDRAWLVANRDQLWAEVATFADMPLYLSPALQAKARLVQAEFEEEEPFQDDVQNMVSTAHSGMGGFDTYPGQLNEAKCFKWIKVSQALKYLGEKASKPAQTRVKASLKKLGWRETQVKGQGRVWRPPVGWTYAVERSLN